MRGQVSQEPHLVCGAGAAAAKDQREIRITLRRDRRRRILLDAQGQHRGAYTAEHNYCAARGEVSSVTASGGALPHVGP